MSDDLDLVKKLRLSVGLMGNRKLLYEAANEIERLRTNLEYEKVCAASIADRDAWVQRAEAAEAELAKLDAVVHALGIEDSHEDPAEEVQKYINRAGAAEAKVAKQREALPDDLRSRGWAVAIHNDYRQDGEDFTFWLLTMEDHCIKGEGRTDAEALTQIRQSLALIGKEQSQ